MGFKFGSTSMERLKTCHPELVNLAEFAIRHTNIDFGIASGHRTPVEQKALYAKGRTEPGQIVTNIDGIREKSKHNHHPSLAFDIYYWNGQKASWNREHLCYLGGMIMACSRILEIPIRWGGNWDGDGIIISDQNLIDLPHFELIV